ncbi:MAG: glycoside hydrolase family 10 protein [Chroococcidiopsidaceae cyanobacterium CP_BM_RX_35]|nr:glycoside hydrolase family 10 protein [Chroococcidiopsidaceae cyanobacterium CP_BM_RX_35]
MVIKIRTEKIRWSIPILDFRFWVPQSSERVCLGSWFALLIALSVTVVIILTTTVAEVGTAAPQATELRGVWLTNIDSDVLFERRRLAKAIQRLQELNFNTLYPTVWNWGYTLYPSPVAKQQIGRSLDPTPGLQGRDLLKEIVKQGHQKGMSVIPWFEFGFMAPADSELASRHPDWLTNRRDGTQIWQEGPHRRVWLNPLHPEVQQFIQDLVVEIVSNYNVDGIQFDDHFGFPADFGYDSLTVNLYQREHPGYSPPANPQDPVWLRWRADKVTGLMRRLFVAVKVIKPECIISVAPNPLKFSYNESLADWKSWEREGLIEELVLQVYRNDEKRFIAELEQPEVQVARSHIPVSIGILTGLKDHMIPVRQIQHQVTSVRQQGLAGVSFFYYETLWNLAQEKAAERQFAFQKLFPAPMERPNIFAGWVPPLTPNAQTPR